MSAYILAGASAARAVPPAPTGDPIASLTVVPTRAGAFAILLVGQSGATYVQRVDRGRPAGAVERIGTGRGALAVAATPSTGAADAYVAVAAKESSTFRLDVASTPAKLLDEQVTVVGPESVAVGRSDADAAPLVGWFATQAGASATVQIFGASSRTDVPTPGLGVGRPSLGASARGGLLAYPTSTGATVVRLTPEGTPSASPPILLSDQEAGLRVSVTDLGDEQIVAYWPNRSPAPHGPIAERFLVAPAAVGGSLEKRVLAIGTSGLVADRMAPGGPDVKIVRNDGRNNTESSWLQTSPDGGAPSTPRILNTRGELASGACNADGCLYAFTSLTYELTYPIVYAPRTGPVVEGDLPRPPSPGGGGGGKPPFDGGLGGPLDAGANPDPSDVGPLPGATASTPGGCSTSGSAGGGLVGALGLFGGLALLGLRRKR